MRKVNYLFGLTLTASSICGTAQAVDVAEDVTTKASPSDAWAMIADFCSISDWHPVIAKCEKEEKDGQVFRTLTTGDGAELYEKLDSIDSDKMMYTYSILEGPLPIANYRSTIAVSEDANGGSSISWVSSFDASGVTDDEAKELLQGIYRAGLDELKILLDK